MTAPTPLDAILATVEAISPSDSTRRLCDDVRSLCANLCDLAACALADALLSSVRDYADYNARLRPLTLAPAGAVLGERRPEVTAGCWWLGVRVGTHQTVPLMGWAASGAAVPEGATHWCVAGGGGWWRVPVAEEARRAA